MTHNHNSLRGEGKQKTDVVLLKQTISDRKASMAYISRRMGKTEQALRNKMSGRSQFNITEVEVLRDVLGLTSDELDAIFFTRRVE